MSTTPPPPPPPPSGAPPPPPPPQQPPGGYGPGGYGPGGYGAAGVPQEHPKGTTILVLGILSLVLCGLLGPFAWNMGNQALAIGLVAGAQMAGLKAFLGSYPITPATDILQYMSLMKNYDVITCQMEDEIAGICTAIGASFAGRLGMTTTSGPGIPAPTASMVQTGQLDGLRMMSIDPLDFVVSPKALAMLVAILLLVVWAWPESSALRAEDGRLDDIQSGFQPAIHLQADLVAQLILDQRLVGFGQADFPGQAGVLDRAERAGAGTAVETCDGDQVGVGLGHAHRDGADAGSRYQLDRHQRVGIDHLEVENQLRQVLDRVYVVVRRR